VVHGKARRLAILGTLLVLGMTACKSTVPKREPPLRGPHPLELVPYATQLKEAKPVTAEELYRVYSQNLDEGAWPDQKYRYRLLHVTGVFNGINQRLPGKVFLELRTRADSAFVYALMAPDDPLDMETLTPGMPLKLLCHGAGMMAGSPLLKDCHRE